MENYLRIPLRILLDDFPETVKNIHDEIEKHHSYKKKACSQEIGYEIWR